MSKAALEGEPDATLVEPILEAMCESIEIEDPPIEDLKDCSFEQMAKVLCCKDKHVATKHIPVGTTVQLRDGIGTLVKRHPTYMFTIHWHNKKPDRPRQALAPSSALPCKVIGGIESIFEQWKQARAFRPVVVSAMSDATRDTLVDLPQGAKKREIIWSIADELVDGNQDLDSIDRRDIVHRVKQALGI